MISATQKAHIKPIHPFPARMAPSIVWDALPDGRKPLRILDPMSGSGTTLVCARAKGHRAIGCDTDPLALTIARAWCSDVARDRLTLRAGLVLARARDLAEQWKCSDVYPKGADDETRQFVNFWFDSDNRRQLTALSTCIARVRSQAERTLLWCAFSRLIITKRVGVSLAMDVSHSRPHKVYKIAPMRCFDVFEKAVGYIVKQSPFQVETESKRGYPSADVRFGDARALPVRSNSVDMIVTSPPYLNAIDYLRGHKLSLVWMGHRIKDIRRLRSENIGTEVSYRSETEGTVFAAIEVMGGAHDLDERRIGMLRRYAHDMNNVLRECARVLRRKGHAIFVVGDSSVRGLFIRNSECIAQLAAAHGFSLVSKIVRLIAQNRRYLPPPNSQQAGSQLQSRMREEVILKFVNDSQT